MTITNGYAPILEQARLLGYGLKSLGVNALVALSLLFSVGAAHAQDAQKTILALGDSLTAGYGLDQAYAFPVQLEAALQDAGHDVRVVNAGVSGDTSAGGRSRLSWLLSEGVDGVIVSLGANDGLRGLDPAETRANLDWILAELKKRDIPALLSGMLAPPNLGRDYGREFNAIYPELAEKYDVVFDPFFLEGVAADPALNQNDGIHPNKEGVEVIVERMVPKVEDLLQRIERPEQKEQD